MEKLDLYLNQSQYEKLCILAKERNMEVEEFANEQFYTLLLNLWLKHQAEEARRILDDPNTDWEE